MNQQDTTKIKIVYAIDSDGKLMGTAAVPEGEFSPEQHVLEHPPAFPHREYYEAYWDRQLKKWSLVLNHYGQEELWRDIKLQRQDFLAKTDWTQMNDVVLSPEKKAAVNQYRQELRDITTKYSSPEEVVWPAWPL